MRVPGHKFFVPAIKRFAGMSRSYSGFQNLSAIERGTA